MSERNRPSEGKQSDNYTHANDENGTSSSTDRGGRFGRLDRRSYLKLGAAAAAGSVAFSGRSTAETRSGISFDRVVDAVDDLGMDNTGSDPIDDALENALSSGTLIEFPAGEYLVTREISYYDGSNFGMVGATGDRSDVEFVFPSGYNDRFLNIRFGGDWLFGDFTIQQTDDRETGVSCSFAPRRDARVENLEIAGFNPRNKQRGLAVAVYNSDAELTLDRIVRVGGSDVGDYPSGTQGILVTSAHDGTVTIKDARIENSGENGIYGSRCDGDVHIEGGYFANNDIASVRIAGEGSYVKDATFVIDTDNADYDGSYDNLRGLWIESGSRGDLGGYVENCDFSLLSASNSGGLIRVQTTAGEVDVRNCRFRNETRFATLFARQPSRVSGSGPINVENCSVTGGASNPRRAAIELVGRDGSLVSDCCVSMDGGQNGVVIRDASGCTVRRSTIDVNGETIYTPGSSVATSGISESGSCPLPSDGGSGAGGDTGSDDGDDSDEESDSGSDDSDSGSEEETDSEDSEEQESDSGGDEEGSESGSDDSSDEQTDSDSDSEDSEDSEEQESDSGGDEEETDSGSDEEDSSRGSGAESGSDDSDSESDDTESDSEEQESDDSGSGSDESDDSGSDESDESGSDGSNEGDSDESEGSDEGDDSDSSSGGVDESSGETRTIRLAGDTVSPYEFTVSGAVDFNPHFGTEDRIDGSTVRGVLAGGMDEYRFTGDITGFDVEGSPTVYVDGESVDPSSLGSDGSEESDSNVVLFESDDLAKYELEVSGDIAFDRDYGTEDSLSENGASGVLAGGTDKYRFTGDITRFEVEDDDEIEVTLNGESVAPDELAN